MLGHDPTYSTMSAYLIISEIYLRKIYPETISGFRVDSRKIAPILLEDDHFPHGGKIACLDAVEVCSAGDSLS